MEKTNEHIITACVGTNVNHQSNITKAREILDSTFADCRFSRVMQTLPIGMENTNVRFANMLVVFKSTFDTEEVVSTLKHIEALCGDTRIARRRGEIVMDIDMLKYDEERFHLSDWQRHYVKALMEEMQLLQLTNV
ncbi:2-amino-4-hydroxy-6-hydroxymethyldihydropteridine diphosphokinase [Prevotella sp.]|uniref:2-amino-4-hydroxy-6- hydroxymethyldihydropteridine diphosphokinase n=1 Tax=uncultured Prevotella sp. TaxID=159272 RepID=UPI0025E74CAC|nr:2-amino-4-hydroxy-6-hydroxymethyldihydropteridine diphosphokinase [uncultured Prevotella sp.]